MANKGKRNKRKGNGRSSHNDASPRREGHEAPRNSVRRRSSERPCLYVIQAHSPIHVGVGEATGYINLPTAREVTTQYPYIPGSSVKGVLREQAEILFGGADEPQVVKAFGPPSERAGDSRGGLVFSDASLLFLPMRSLELGFVMVSSPLILRRFRRELMMAGYEELADHITQDLLAGPGSDDAVFNVFGQGMLIEDMKLEGKTSEALSTLWAGLEGLGLIDEADTTTSFYEKRLAVVSDELFSYFVRLNLEVRSRVKIDPKTGTAAGSGPWLEEYMPAETLLYGIVMGRTTAYIPAPTMLPGEDARAAGEGNGSPAGEASLDDLVPETVSAEDNMNILASMGLSSAFLRFGGKSSVGSGRAIFRLTKVAGEAGRAQ